MRIVRYHSGVPAEARGAIVALGNFDGVHRGHQVVFEASRRIARKFAAPLAVVTFEPHPSSVLRPDIPPFRLTPFRVKARTLAALGADFLVIIRFDLALARKEPEQFVSEHLIEGLEARHVVVGQDFCFGKGRAGNAELLSRLSREYGFGFTCVQAAGDEEVFSSSRVREALRSGAMTEAAAVLGRWWELEERVRKGEARGQRLGYPTANLRLGGLLSPARGIYAVWAGISGSGEVRWYPAVASFGSRPTFDGTEEIFEVHVFGFEGDLYGRWLRVRLVAFIRPELKFDDAESLKAEMARDCARAKALLGRVGVEGPAPPRPQTVGAKP